VRAAKRLEAAKGRINRFPYKYEAIDDAYARFLEDGTLPEDRALAGRVLHRVLYARKPVPELAAEQRTLGLHQPYGTTREMLFREAVCTVEPARGLAQLLLRCLVQDGYDPTDPEVIGPELEPADFATVSMQLLGWPRDFVRPQYQEQLERVLQQQATVRASRPRNNDEWDRGAGSALSAFLCRGVVPSDSRYFLFVLTTGESFALHGHYFGHGNEELLAAFDSVATASEGQREAALLHLGALQARSGGLGNHAG
jgi:hypothetical protein